MMRLDISTINCGYFDHFELVYFMQALGYKACHAGVCYGYAGAGLQALLLNETDKHNLRLKWMTYIYREAEKVSDAADAAGSPDADSLFNATVKEYLEKIKSGTILVSEEDQKIVAEIPAFCESIEMHFQPEYYQDWFETGKEPSSQDIKITLPLMLPDQLRTCIPDENNLYNDCQSKVVWSSVFTGAYSYSDLVPYFESLRNILEVTNTTVALLLCNVSHAMAVSYDYKNKQWLHLDVCGIPVRRTDSINDIAYLVDYYFSNNHTTLFSTQMFGLNKNLVDEVYSQWRNHEKWQDIHRITPGKASLQDWNDATWLHVASQNNDVTTVTGLLELDLPEKKYYDKKTYDGKTPLLFAAEEGYDAVVEKLINKGADPHAGKGLAALHIAVNKKNVSMARALLAGGAAVNGSCGKDELTPLSRAIESEDAEMVKVLLEYGADIENVGKSPAPLSRAIEKANQSVLRALLTYAPPVSFDILSKAANEHWMQPIHVLVKKFYYLQRDLAYPHPERNHDSHWFKAVCKIHAIALERNNRALKRVIKNFKFLEEQERRISSFEPRSGREEQAAQAFQPIFAAAYDQFCASPFDMFGLFPLKQQIDGLLRPHKRKERNGLFDNRGHAEHDCDVDENRYQKKYKSRQ